MKIFSFVIGISLWALFFHPAMNCTAQTDSTIKVFQFPPDRIPCIDGNTNDWKMVPDQYKVGIDQYKEDNHKFPAMDTNDLNVTVHIGWVKGLNRLYFLYEAYDNYWDFSRVDLHHDILELVVDGDYSGGPLIERFHPRKGKIDPQDAYLSMQGVQAQNYHIYTPAEGQDWCLVWGCQPWIKNLPWSNCAYNYHFKPGEPGVLTMEFWITPFDYAGAEGSERAVESVLYENKKIGLGWAILDFDDVNASDKTGFWNICNKHTMYGNATELRTAVLMPMEPFFLRKNPTAQWSFKVMNSNTRQVAFRDISEGKITTWKWDFGDGTFSDEQNPIHDYRNAGSYIVVLYIEGPDGKDRRAKVWDVVVR